MNFRGLEFIKVYWQTWIVALGPLLLSPILFLSTDTQQEKEAFRCGYLILLMILYWLTEALPLPVTAMIPMVGFPLLGLMSTKDVAVNYLNATNYMFFGGLIMAIAVEHCGLHLRVALRIIKMVGTSQARLMLGFMFTTMFISMWISNTATTAMMIPIVNAVVKAINSKEEDGEDGNETQRQQHEDIEITGDETKPLINTESFESELKQLTNGKIDNIDQLKSLVKLDDGCGHFEDLETITKNNPAPVFDAASKTDNKESVLPRSRTMKRLKSQQSVEKEIRKKERYHSDTHKARQDEVIEEDDNDESEVQRNYLLLGIAMSSNIGGTGVVTGTPPNLVAPDVLGKKFGEGTSGLTFASWMAFAIPVMLVNLILAWLWLQQLMAWSLGKRSSDNKKEKESKAMRAINKKYEELGKMTVHEIQVMILFIILILLWFFKTPIFIPGWSDLFDATNSNGDTVAIAQATPAILIVLLLFVLPKTYNFWPCSDSKGPFKKSPALITWRLIETKMCWGVLFLLGGGFTLAKCLQTSGLSLMLVAQLTKMNLSSFPGWVASLIFTGLAVIITNLCSNTATANVFVPILADLAITMCLHPVYLTLPAAIACSYAFSLPVSTAPNAIVYGNSTMKTVDMFKAGIVMNLICFLVLVLAINTYAVPMFGLDTFPDWAALDSDIRGRCAANSTL